MTAAELLDELARRGVQVWAQGGKLRFRSPPGALAPEDRARLRERRDEVLAWLEAGLPRGRRAEGALRLDPAARHEPFPLTDIQQAYWVGSSRAFELGGFSAQTYMELDAPRLDPGRLQAAWRRLIERHPMLRAHVLPDGRQRVLARTPPYRITTVDLRHLSEAEARRALESVRRCLSHRGPDLSRWPLFHLAVSLSPTGGRRLHFGISLLLCDAWSFRRLFRETLSLYAAPERALPPLELTFRDCVLARREQASRPTHRRSLAYWRERIPRLPGPPPLPVATAPREVSPPRFVRHSGSLPRAGWGRLKDRAAASGLTPSALLATAYAVVLGAWSGHRHFLLNLLFFNRPLLHPQIDGVVGNFSSTLLLEVDLEDGTFDFDRAARRVQSRLLADLEHARVSGIEVLREIQQHRGGGGGGLAGVPVVFASTVDLDTRGGASRTAAGGSPFELVYGSMQTPQIWLDHQASEQEGELAYTWDAVDGLFAPGAVEAHFATYGELLRRLADSDAAWRLPVGELVAPEAGSAPAGARTAAPVEEDAEPEGEASPERVEELAEIWARLLDAPSVGADDDFFTLGGHSLLVVRLMGEIEERYGVELPLGALFDGPTVRHMAATLDRALRRRDAAEPG